MNTHHDQARLLRELVRQTRASCTTARCPITIVVAGGCPGVGATTVTARLAAEFARQPLQIGLQQKVGPQSQMRPESDIAFIDSGAGLSEETAPIWNRANLVLLVTTEVRDAVLATYGALKKSKALNVSAAIWLVPNQCHNEQAAAALHQRISESCKRFLGCAIPAAPWLPILEANRESFETTSSVAALARFCRDQIPSLRPSELCHDAA